MKGLKKILSIGCAVLTLASSMSFISVSADPPTVFKNGSRTQNEIKNNWSTYVNEEKSKYPETAHDQQTYWNGGNLDSFSLTPCTPTYEGSANHDRCNIMDSTTYFQFYKPDYSMIIEHYTDDRGKPHNTTYSQCYAFALKIASDIYKASVFCRYPIDSTGYITYSDGTKSLYQPQLGDVLRISTYESATANHSIIITGISGSNITFAQCNADGHCEIDWDQTRIAYHNNSGNITYYAATASRLRILARNGHVERVCKIGDLNLDGKIDSNDITKLQSFLTTGKAEFPLQAADADENRVINENDITALQNIINKGSSNLGHAVLNPYNITSPINSNINGDFIYNGASYKINGSSVSFMGLIDSRVKNFSIPGIVYNSNDNKSYTVSQIGYPDAPRPGANSGLLNLETITVPGSVTTIHNFAFYGGKLKSLNLTSLYGLTEINYCAFTNCTQLQSVTLPRYIRTIGTSAFAGCTSLTSFNIDSDAYGVCQLTKINASAFSNCNQLRQLNLPFVNSLTIENGVFAYMSATTTSPVKINLGAPKNPIYSIITLNSSEVDMYNNKTLIFTGSLSNYTLKDSNGNIINWK